MIVIRLHCIVLYCIDINTCHVIIRCVMTALVASACIISY